MEPELIRFCGLGPLAGLLATAVSRDLAGRPTPNALVLGGTTIAILLHALLPGGYGFFGLVPGGLGVTGALAGLAVGLSPTLVLLALRMQGALDLRLLGMVGAFIGPGDVLGALLATLVASKGLSLLGTFARLAPIGGPQLRVARNAREAIPASFAIAVGTAAWCGWRLAG